MTTQPYSFEAHMQTICRWLYLRDHYIPSKSEMPAIGFVAYDGKEPIAAAFLRKVEGGYAQLDGLVSNPEASPAQRNEGIDLVVESVIQAAKDAGIVSLCAMTRDKSTLMRSSKHGFVQQPETFIVLSLAAKSPSEDMGAHS